MMGKRSSVLVAAVFEGGLAPTLAGNSRFKGNRKTPARVRPCGWKLVRDRVCVVGAASCVSLRERKLMSAALDTKKNVATLRISGLAGGVRQRVEGDKVRNSAHTHRRQKKNGRGASSVF